MTTRETTDLITVLEEIGVVITAVRDDRVHGLCPRHEERTGKVDASPSWSIDRDLHLHHCFSCGYSGTLRSMITDLMDLPADWVSEWLAEHEARLVTVRLRTLGRRKRAAAPGPEPERLLKGFVDPPDKALAERHLERFAVNHYGVMWDPAAKAWILPIRSDNGALLGYQRKRKRIVRNVPKKMWKRTTLFGIDKFPEHGRAILVESPLDAVRLYSEGIQGGVSSFGAEVDPRQMELLRLHADELVLALDNDTVGQRQTEALWAQYWNTSGLELYKLDYGDSKAKDVGEMTGDEIHKRVLNPYRDTWGRF